VKLVLHALSSESFRGERSASCSSHISPWERALTAHCVRYKGTFCPCAKLNAANVWTIQRRDKSLVTTNNWTAISRSANSKAGRCLHHRSSQWVGGLMKSRAMIAVPVAARKRYLQPIAGQPAISVCILLHNGTLSVLHPTQSAPDPRRWNQERARLRSVLQGPTNFW
jgi:hypothetical protein